tara:strand:+ start:817 stop:1113 length:297 start_codon:yes stop_codon:yes gene_type:complete
MVKNFTRKDLSNKIFSKLGFSKNYSSTFIDNFFETLSNNISKTNKLKITNFGTFRVITKKERIGRNPKTKVDAKISQRKVIKFKAASFFKKKINNNEK